MCNRWPFLVLNTVLFLVWIHFHKWARDTLILLTSVFTHPILCIKVCVCVCECQVSCCSSSLFGVYRRMNTQNGYRCLSTCKILCVICRIWKIIIIMRGWWGRNTQDCNFFGGLIVNWQRLKWNSSILHQISRNFVFMQITAAIWGVQHCCNYVVAEEIWRKTSSNALLVVCSINKYAEPWHNSPNWTLISELSYYGLNAKT